MAHSHTSTEYCGWDIYPEHRGFEAYNADYDESMWAATNHGLIAALDAYEAELDAALGMAQAHLAAMAPARRAILEGEWA